MKKLKLIKRILYFLMIVFVMALNINELKSKIDLSYTIRYHLEFDINDLKNYSFINKDSSLIFLRDNDLYRFYKNGTNIHHFINERDLKLLIKNDIENKLFDQFSNKGLLKTKFTQVVHIDNKIYYLAVIPKFITNFDENNSSVGMELEAEYVKQYVLLYKNNQNMTEYFIELPTSINSRKNDDYFILNNLLGKDIIIQSKPYLFQNDDSNQNSYYTMLISNIKFDGKIKSERMDTIRINSKEYNSNNNKFKNFIQNQNSSIYFEDSQYFYENKPNQNYCNLVEFNLKRYLQDVNIIDFISNNKTIYILYHDNNKRNKILVVRNRVLISDTELGFNSENLQLYTFDKNVYITNLVLERENYNLDFYKIE